MKKIIFAWTLILSSQLIITDIVNAAKTSRLVSNKRVVKSTTLRTSTTTSSDEEEEDVKTQDDCKQIFYTCMDKKTNESVMQYETFYDDYNDMLTDIYDGMTSPVFKCIYSNNAKDLYETYYYNQSGLDASGGRTQKTRKNSIAYYNFLKQNANDVATKKITANLVYPEVLTIAAISVSPLDASPQSVPDVSYKFTTINPKNLLELNTQYCLDSEKNKNLEGCPKLKKTLVEDWKNLGPNTLTKNCQDYETFLVEKRSKAKQAAETFILSLKTQITNAINEYNAKIEAQRELFN
ncbi:hypothetical protein HDR59_05410 [bacterium]|nr:hypothetical protein [bacterium]